MWNPLSVAAVLLLFRIGAWAAAEGSQEAVGAADSELLYRIVNFAIFAGGIGYLLVKFAGPALRVQQRDILEHLAQASRRAEAAQAEAEATNRKVAGLETDIAAMRDAALAEIAEEKVRIESETAALLAKLEASAELEIESSKKFAVAELKAYAAQLAVDLARSSLTARMNDRVQARLVEDFSRHLASQGREAR